MNTNVTKTGTTYNFNVTDGDYAFNGSCEKTLTTISIHGNVEYSTSISNDINDNRMPGASNIGSFNYHLGENNVDFNTNIYDREQADDVITALLPVIAAVKDEVSGNNN